MRIMSLNGWGGKLHEALISYLQSDQPDVLCLQEVVHSRRPRKIGWPIGAATTFSLNARISSKTSQLLCPVIRLYSARPPKACSGMMTRRSLAVGAGYVRSPLPADLGASTRVRA